MHASYLRARYDANDSMSRFGLELSGECVSVTIELRKRSKLSKGGFDVDS